MHEHMNTIHVHACKPKFCDLKNSDYILHACCTPTLSLSLFFYFKASSLCKHIERSSLLINHLLTEVNKRERKEREKRKQISYMYSGTINLKRERERIKLYIRGSVQYREGE